MTAPTIALLDNDSSFLSLMHDLLTTEGYRTLHWRPRDAIDAHAMVVRCNPALVILDRWWRSNDGWEFLKHLWADPQTAHIGVVLTHGRPISPSLQADLLRAMPCRIVRTPLDRHEVLRAIEAVIGLSSPPYALARPIAGVRRIDQQRSVASRPYAAEHALDAASDS